MVSIHTKRKLLVFSFVWPHFNAEKREGELMAGLASSTSCIQHNISTTLLLSKKNPKNNNPVTAWETVNRRHLNKKEINSIATVQQQRLTCQLTMADFKQPFPPQTNSFTSLMPQDHFSTLSACSLQYFFKHFLRNHEGTGQRRYSSFTQKKEDYCVG